MAFGYNVTARVDHPSTHANKIKKPSPWETDDDEITTGVSRLERDRSIHSTDLPKQKYLYKFKINARFYAFISSLVSAFRIPVAVSFDLHRV